MKDELRYTKQIEDLDIKVINLDNEKLALQASLPLGLLCD